MGSPPRTTPVWVRSRTADEHDMPMLPESVLQQAKPDPKAAPGRKLDHARSADTVVASTPDIQTLARWKPFVDTCGGPGRPSTGRTIRSDEWMEKNWPYNFDEPWQPLEPTALAETDNKFWLFSPEKRKKSQKRLGRQIINNPLVPLIFRLLNLTFSITALALAASIWMDRFSCNTSSIPMAVIFDAFAIVYVLFTIWDEYHSGPLSLRSHKAKVLFMFADLVFIIVNSTNLTLAFLSLKCQQKNGGVLVATLFLALLAWVCTFMVSTLRIVDRAVVRTR